MIKSAVYDGFAIAKVTLDASMHLCASGAVKVLYGAVGDSRRPQAETACCHHRVPATHGRLYDILFSQGSITYCILHTC